MSVVFGRLWPEVVGIEPVRGLSIVCDMGVGCSIGSM